MPLIALIISQVKWREIKIKQKYHKKTYTIKCVSMCETQRPEIRMCKWHQKRFWTLTYATSLLTLYLDVETVINSIYSHLIVVSILEVEIWLYQEPKRFWNNLMWLESKIRFLERNVVIRLGTFSHSQLFSCPKDTLNQTR